ncbi:MAG: toll/interleukin-1 receptor domain-containing protein [Acidobacteria bacterium]|nr:toll/interleukin-1 receptor domain-containing protein [Acidobacteriota bacterium]
MAKVPFDPRGGSADYIADQQVSRDPNLVLFVSHFGRSMEIYQEGTAVDFVNELHRRWLERYPEGAGSSEPVAIAPDMAPGSVFLSYAREDQQAVARIKVALESAGVDVFFDKTRIRVGDAWEPKLRRCVRERSLFVPVISRHSLTNERRYFRMEWNLALEEAQRASFADEDSFLLPVVLDETSAGETAIPEKFRAHQWQPLPDGQPTPAFVTRVQQLYRKYQKSSGGRN